MKRTNPPEWKNAKYGMYLVCQYNTDFIEELKRDVPANEREWNSARKQWWISDAYLDEVDVLLFRYFEQSGYGRDD